VIAALLAGAVAAASLGQWVWSARDEAVLAQSRSVLGEVRSAVWIGTVRFSDGAIRPALAQRAGAADELVIRLDDSLHLAWDALGERQVAEQVDAAVAALLAPSGTDARPLQLDYDAPVRRIPMWGRVVRHVGASAARGRALWITSLPAHLRHAGFGSAFAGAVSGHILQVFDTGSTASATEAGSLAVAAGRAGLPFRLGLGAFERRGTGHRAWFGLRDTLEAAPGYAGAWIFPAGRAWGELWRRTR
jgi:hypothetical protein